MTTVQIQVVLFLCEINFSLLDEIPVNGVNSDHRVDGCSVDLVPGHLNGENRTLVPGERPQEISFEQIKVSLTLVAAR